MHLSLGGWATPRPGSLSEQVGLRNPQGEQVQGDGVWPGPHRRRHTGEGVMASPTPAGEGEQTTKKAEYQGLY